MKTMKYFYFLAVFACFFVSCSTNDIPVAPEPEPEQNGPTLKEKNMVKEQMTWRLDSVEVIKNYQQPNESRYMAYAGKDINAIPLMYTFYPCDYQFPEDLVFHSDMEPGFIHQISEQFNEAYCKYLTTYYGEPVAAGYLTYYNDQFAFYGLQQGGWVEFMIREADTNWNTEVWTCAYNSDVEHDGTVNERIIEYYSRVNPDDDTDFVGGFCGIDGDNMLTWELNRQTGLLTISGNGAMADYDDPSEAPWYSYSKSIIHLVIEEGVTHISQSGFQYMPYLESAEIAESIISIGDYAFYGSSLNKINPLLWVGDVDVSLLPGGIESIGAYAFAETQLENITLPTFLKNIGTAAFAYNDALQEVTCLATTPSESGRAVFFECNKLWVIIVPDGKVEAYTAADGWATYASIIAPVSGRPEKPASIDNDLGLPSSMCVTDLGKTSALVICSLPDGATGWNLNYRQEVADNEQEMRWVTYDNLTTRSYTIENLKPGTNYVVRLQAVFGEGQVSGWTRALPFTTLNEDAGERENKQEQAFADYKEVKKDECNAMAMPEIDDKHCSLLIDQAKQAIEALAFDENKSLDENLEALDTIVRQLAIDLSIHRSSIY